MSTLQTTNHSLDFFASSVCGLPCNPVHLEPSLLLPLEKFGLGKTPTSSQKSLGVAFVALGEVVNRTFGGEFGSQSEKYDANVSEPMSTKFSGATDTPSMNVVSDPLEPSIGREVESSKHYPVSAVNRWSIRKGQIPIDCRGSWGGSRSTCS